MAQQADIAVDLALVLAVDVSSSVDSGDYDLQMQGIAEALRQPALPQAIGQGQYQRIALSLVHWSSWDRQAVAVPWQLLSTESDLADVAAKVEKAERQWKPGGTGLAAALTFCAALVLAFPLRASRRVIDVSGDGEDNDGGDVIRARNEAVARGITINGLPLVYGSRRLLSYYTNRVVGGSGAFVQPARDIRDFRQQMTVKLLREVQPWTT